MAAMLGLCSLSYGRLCAVGFPVIMFTIMQQMMSAHGPPTSTVDMIEYFCGVANIATEFGKAGYKSLGYDVLFDPTHCNMCSESGFIYALYLAMSLSPTGLAWFGTVCSSWIWISQASTRRSATLPLGDWETSDSVFWGNVMVARCGVLQLLIAARRGWFALEQPRGSLMTMHPTVMKLKEIGQAFAWMHWHTQNINMAGHCADTLKPTELHSNARWLPALYRQAPKAFKARNTEMVKISTREDGSCAVTGGKGLKQSQAYTPEFSQNVLDAFVVFRGNTVEVLDDDHCMLEDPSAWEWGRFNKVLEFLQA